MDSCSSPADARTLDYAPRDIGATKKNKTAVAAVGLLSFNSGFWGTGTINIFASLITTGGSAVCSPKNLRLPRWSDILTHLCGRLLRTLVCSGVATLRL